MSLIFLTSTGISTGVVREAFVDRVGSDRTRRVAIITTASPEKAENKYAQLTRSQFQELGFTGNVVYLGISAGSVILGPTIKEASVVNPDPNGIGLTDFTGLGILAYEKTVPHKVIRLTDIQAMIVLGSDTQLVS